MTCDYDTTKKEDGSIDKFIMTVYGYTLEGEEVSVKCAYYFDVLLKKPNAYSSVDILLQGVDAKNKYVATMAESDSTTLCDDE